MFTVVILGVLFLGGNAFCVFFCLCEGGVGEILMKNYCVYLIGATFVDVNIQVLGGQK